MLLLLAACALALASPLWTPASPLASWTPAASDQSTCGPPSFEPATAAPADWRHCAALLSAWAGRNGTISIHTNGTGGGGGGGGNDTADGAYVPLLTTRGCALGVRAGAARFYTIGDRDVEGVMRTALGEWSGGTEVSVRGAMECAVDGGGRAALRWQIGAN